MLDRNRYVVTEHNKFTAHGFRNILAQTPNISDLLLILRNDGVGYQVLLESTCQNSFEDVGVFVSC